MKKYPVSLFIIGFLMNLTKNFFLLLSGLILLFIGIWVNWCFTVGVALLLIDVIISLLEQITIMNTTLNSDNPNFKEIQDAVLSPDWKDNVKDLVQSKIEDSDEQGFDD
jgi:hypothetical protein